MSNDLVLRWGIASAGNISKDFCTALLSLKSEFQVVQAVAARNADDAKSFAEKFNIQSHYGSYDELMQDSQVNIVYVGSITTTHKDICLKAINAGKHVLCKFKLIFLSSMEIICLTLLLFKRRKTNDS
jgi:dihydrodiol dehydrogenase / D-xylose 1-dehydrogenase (NADP)